MKIKTINEFKKLFKEKEGIEQEGIEPIKELITYIDGTNVLAVIPKTEDFNNSFKGIFETEQKDKDFEDNVLDGDYQISHFSSEYFKIISQILSTIDGKVTLKVKKDHPLVVETEHFKIVLAPRIED